MRRLILVLPLFFMLQEHLRSSEHEDLLDSGYSAVRVYVTAYCPCRICCGKYADGSTSTGKRIQNVTFRRSGGTPHYGIAADPRRVPYDSTIIYPAYKPSRYYPAGYAWPVDDTGSAMRNKRYIHLDFRFINHNNALKWARKNGGWQTVYIKEAP